MSLTPHTVLCELTEEEEAFLTLVAELDERISHWRGVLAYWEKRVATDPSKADQVALAARRLRLLSLAYNLYVVNSDDDDDDDNDNYDPLTPEEEKYFKFLEGEGVFDSRQNG